MHQGYFSQVTSQTDTRLWINNPTSEEVKEALEAGAIACTTNPTYSARMLHQPGTRGNVLKIIDKSISETILDEEVAAFVQRSLVAEMALGFMPHFLATSGREGFVSIQMNPYLEKDSYKIVTEALIDFALFPNCIAKIPVIPTGLEAIDCLVRLNKPVIATEVMAISQAIAACETYQKASEESGNTPAFFITHISGIFDEQLKAEAEAMGIELSPEAARLAGCAVAKKQYALLQKRGLPGILLGGGARDLHHFTEMVGGKVHVTLNWSGTAMTLERNPPKIENLFDIPVPETIIRELSAKLPTFKNAYAEDGLKTADFHDFSPVVRFRTQFMNGWDELLKIIGERRAMVSSSSEKDDQKQTGDLAMASVCRGFCRVGENPPVEIRPGIFRSTLVYNKDNMLCYFREKQGARVDLHTHFAVQSGYVIKGKVKFFDAEGNERILGPGDGYLFNSNEPHGSIALEETVLVESFTPARPEYLDKDERS